MIKLALLALSLIFTGQFDLPVKNTPVAKKENKDLVVALLPYKGFDASLLEFIQKETETFYHCKVLVLKSVDLPSFAFYGTRSRYKSDSLLVYENRLVRKGINAMVGLTSKDISTTKDKISHWGVFGLGMCPGPACVISTYRLKGASVSTEKLKERLIKVVLHEIGHNLGLPHCSANAECLMTDAGGTIKQVDMEKKWLCPACRIKLIL